MFWIVAGIRSGQHHALLGDQSGCGRHSVTRATLLLLGHKNYTRHVLQRSTNQFGLVANHDNLLIDAGSSQSIQNPSHESFACRLKEHFG